MDGWTGGWAVVWMDTDGWMNPRSQKTVGSACVYFLKVYVEADSSSQ